MWSALVEINKFNLKVEKVLMSKPIEKVTAIGFGIDEIPEIGGEVIEFSKNFPE